MYAFTYQSLMNRLATLPAIKHIDVFNGQPMRPKTDEESYDKPAVFIEFAPIQWQHRAQGRRTAEITILFHLETEIIGQDSAKRTPDAQRTIGLAYMELLDSLYVLLAGYTDSSDVCNYSELTVAQDQLNVNSDVTREDILSFKTCVVDDSAIGATSTVDLPQVIAVSQQ